ncbi:hypothetical protein CCO03_10010 [Comamonas serinivorans]|uniref:ABC transporter domain-containing protein n=1 Tax=Comamonas serinivorans TaxID=1082851 RepID=A0A1Y0ENI3_9BURK|nr:ABC transporter ATP-binding protein [Comamonas serinivorans]ARU04971.1 hypothetical protein CCO03_10010 [Comamonas serinivorans]
MALLDVRALSTQIQTRAGPVTVVDGVSFSVDRGQTLALVGESGSGKSVTALSLLRLLDPLVQPRITGQVLLDGQDVLAMPRHRLRALRGNQIAMIFQEPLSALNPVLRVGEQVAEAVRLHHDVGHREGWLRAIELLDRVHIAQAAARARDYPHQLSGGMRQRVMIAMALACKPKLLIADEPTTALDVNTQAQILDLLRELQAQDGLALLLISHDLGVVADMADRVAVMYAGRVVEYADAGVLFQSPAHPYSRGLLDSVALDGVPPQQPLPEIPGVVPLLSELPPGCAFAPRCTRATAECERQVPALQNHGRGDAGLQAAACLHPLPRAETPSEPALPASQLAAPRLRRMAELVQEAA